MNNSWINFESLRTFAAKTSSNWMLAIFCTLTSYWCSWAALASLTPTRILPWSSSTGTHKKPTTEHPIVQNLSSNTSNIAADSLSFYHVYSPERKSCCILLHWYWLEQWIRQQKLCRAIMTLLSFGWWCEIALHGPTTHWAKEPGMDIFILLSGFHPSGRPMLTEILLSNFGTVYTRWFL